jgi:hypothetical protein
VSFKTYVIIIRGLVIIGKGALNFKQFSKKDVVVTV